MAKYTILYSAKVSSRELIAKATPEQMKRSMEEWLAWREDALKVAKVEFHSPLAALNRVTADGIEPAASEVVGYSEVEGESKEAILEMLAKHPHLMRPGATIDVLEQIAMPGIDA